jgi:branched-chain amino acid transport system substrate-binding protein
VTLRARALAVLVATAAAASACTGGSGAPPATTVVGAADPLTVRVAFFHDSSIESPNTHGLPAFLGMNLAFSRAIEEGTMAVAPELVSFDTAGDPGSAATMAAEVAADPTYVAAVAGPYWEDAAGVSERLGAAGIPVLSLSVFGGSGGDTWFPLVAGAWRQATTLAGYVRGIRGAGGSCLAGDDSPYSRSLMELLGTELRGALLATVTLDLAGGDVAQAAASIERAGCSSVLWTGFGIGAGELRHALTEAGAADVLMVGADAMKDGDYLDLSGAAADGTVVACPCADLSTSPDASAQRFVHDYQADYATPPGNFAAEGWDAGGMLLRAFAAGDTTASAVLEELRTAPPFEGLATTYELDSGRPSSLSRARVRLYRAEAGLWVPAGTPETDALPLRTPGVLAVGSCRTGAPYAYRDARGRLTGFDVGFARSIARRLDLALSWTRTSCRSGTGPVDRGRVDVLLTPEEGLVPGTPASRPFLSTRAGLVAPRGVAHGQRFIATLGPGDVVGLAASAPIPAWAARALDATGASLRSFRRDPARAYRQLQRGAIATVADTEPAAWAAIEHRPRLVVALTDDTGDDDVMVTGPGTELLAAVEGAFQEMIDEGAYALLFGTYFPGATMPDTIGT